MKTIPILIMLLVCVPSFAFGGEIFGTLTEGGKSVGAEAEVELTCLGRSEPRQRTNTGIFRFSVQEQGKCTLKVYYKGQSPSTEIFSEAGEMRYEFALEKEDGKYTLRSK